MLLYIALATSAQTRYPHDLSFRYGLILPHVRTSISAQILYLIKLLALPGPYITNAGGGVSEAPGNRYIYNGGSSGGVFPAK